MAISKANLYLIFLNISRPSFKVIHAFSGELGQLELLY